MSTASLEAADLQALVDTLESSSRIQRQKAAEELNKIAHDDINSLVPYVKNFINALDIPEAKTRWQCIEVLEQMLATDVKGLDKALPGVENSLSEEDFGIIRLASFRFLCAYGLLSKAHSEKVWPYISEAVQFCHGDPEFNDMLIALQRFAQGKISPTVKEELKERMRFDAESNKGVIAKRATKIIEILS